MSAAGPARIRRERSLAGVFLGRTRLYRPPADRALRALVRHSVRRGFGGSRSWLALVIVATGVRVIRRAARAGPEVVYRTELRPDDTVLVSARPRP